MKYELLNGSNLAYIGDAYLELIIRKYLIDKGISKNEELMKESIKYVSATAHTKIYEKIKNELTEVELGIFKRGKNNKSGNQRKNVDKKEHSISTGLEAVIGYLYLMKEFERLDYLMNLILNMGEEK